MEQGNLFSSVDTLAIARRELESKLNDGGSFCKCCGQWSKLNAYTFNKTMAKNLLWMRLRGGDWIDMPATAPVDVKGTNQFQTCKHWGLIEAQPNRTDPTRKSKGIWRITPTGMDFVDDRISIPKTVYVYNREVHGFSDDRTAFSDVCPRFDYEKAMGDRMGSH